VGETLKIPFRWQETCKRLSIKYLFFEEYHFSYLLPIGETLQPERLFLVAFLWAARGSVRFGSVVFVTMSPRSSRPSALIRVRQMGRMTTLPVCRCGAFSGEAGGGGNSLGPRRRRLRPVDRLKGCA